MVKRSVPGLIIIVLALSFVSAGEIYSRGLVPTPTPTPTPARPRVATTVSPTPTATPTASPTPAKPTQSVDDLRSKIAQRVFGTEVKRARVGVKIASLNTGKVIYEYDADKYFTPASN